MLWMVLNGAGVILADAIISRRFVEQVVQEHNALHDDSDDALDKLAHELAEAWAQTKVGWDEWTPGERKPYINLARAAKEHLRKAA